MKKNVPELDELDLFGSGDELAQSPDDSIGLQLSALSARMQKRFEEHREAESQAEQDARSRQGILLLALMRIRKILRGVASLDIGAGVELKLSCDDLQGWPRMTVTPRKVDDADLEFSTFEVTGNDRSGVSQIDIQTNSGKIREQLLLMREEDLERVPRLMKRVVRFYLDSLAEEILSAKKKPKFEEKLAPAAIEELHPASEALKSADLFEDALEEEILETLPELEQLQKL